MNKGISYEEALSRFGRLVYATSGGSMRPFIRSGEDAVVIEAKPWGRYDAVLYRREDGQYVLHRIVDICPEGYVLQGDNCRQREPGIREDQILGVLTAVIRKGRTVDVNRPLYRMRVRLWCVLRPVRLMEFGRKAAWSIRKRLGRN